MNLSKFSSFKNEEYSFNFDDYLNMKEIRNFSNNLMEESKKLISFLEKFNLGQFEKKNKICFTNNRNFFI